jgi:hypothetical protein
VLLLVLSLAGERALERGAERAIERAGERALERAGRSMCMHATLQSLRAVPLYNFEKNCVLNAALLYLCLRHGQHAVAVSHIFGQRVLA